MNFQKKTGWEGRVRRREREKERVRRSLSALKAMLTASVITLNLLVFAVVYHVIQ